MCKGTPHRHLEISVEVSEVKRDKTRFLLRKESGIANAVLETTAIYSKLRHKLLHMSSSQSNKNVFLAPFCQALWMSVKL